ncbi:hypothetical protein ACFFRR_009883 [Megaselia abdita]
MYFIFQVLVYLLILSLTTHCSDNFDEDLNQWFDLLNSQYLQMNQYSSQYTWDLTVNPSSDILRKANLFGTYRANWKNEKCSQAANYIWKMNILQKRMIWILCRGPRYTSNEAGKLSKLLIEMQDIYSGTKICLPISFDICININRIWNYTYVKTYYGDIEYLNMSPLQPMFNDDNLLNYYNRSTPSKYSQQYISSINESIIDGKIRSSNLLCLDIENDLEKIMSGNFSALQRDDCALPANIIMQWSWESWRTTISMKFKNIYPMATDLMNDGARNNGYKDIGQCWQEEMEIPDLPEYVKKLWNKLKPSYQLLHSVLRDALSKKYEGFDLFKKTSTMPAHLLGNMWSQDWSSYHKLLDPFPNVDLNSNLRNKMWTPKDIVEKADDFYSSMGLNPMTEQFWKHSKFINNFDSMKCHGSAADMFVGDDFRMIACLGNSFDDLYVAVHELGHIEYYMHLNNLPPIFQESTNSAIGEAIGDAIFLSFMSPSHLNRLGLIHDRFLRPSNQNVYDINEWTVSNRRNMLDKNGLPILLYDEMLNNYERTKVDKNISFLDISILLKLALSKIPQIPFSFIVDHWRWSYFSKNISREHANDYFWKLCINEQGIHPPDMRNRSSYFDPPSKFHVADNTPYVRYFLASILQTQIFKGLCEKTIFGSVNTGKKLPMPLHRCDIYGSKRAGNLLKKAMEFGSSLNYSEVLLILTGTRQISLEPFFDFYGPLFKWLETMVLKNNINVGW